VPVTVRDLDALDAPGRTDLSGGLPPDEQARITRIASEEGVEPRWLAAIRLAENGRAGREFGVLSQPAPTYEAQARAAAKSLKASMARFRAGGREPVDEFGAPTTEWIDAFASQWAPVGAANDPTGLNRHFPSNFARGLGVELPTAGPATPGRSAGVSVADLDALDRPGLLERARGVAGKALGAGVEAFTKGATEAGAGLYQAVAGAPPVSREPTFGGAPGRVESGNAVTSRLRGLGRAGLGVVTAAASPLAAVGAGAEETLREVAPNVAEYQIAPGSVAAPARALLGSPESLAAIMPTLDPGLARAERERILGQPATVGELTGAVAGAAVPVVGGLAARRVLRGRGAPAPEILPAERPQLALPQGAIPQPPSGLPRPAPVPAAPPGTYLERALRGERFPEAEAEVLRSIAERRRLRGMERAPEEAPAILEGPRTTETPVVDEFGRPVEAGAPTMSERERLRILNRTPLDAPRRAPGALPEFVGGAPPEDFASRGIIRPVSPADEPGILRGRAAAPPESTISEPPIPPPAPRVAVGAGERLLQTPDGQPIARLKLLRGEGRGMGTYEVVEWLGGEQPMPAEFGQQTYRGYFEGRTDPRLLSSVTRDVTREGAPLGYLQLTSGDVQYLAPEAAAPAPAPAGPRYERTALGDQAVVPGTPRPELPNRKLRGRAEQAPVEETPLFGQERAARDAASDAAQTTLPTEPVAPTLPPRTGDTMIDAGAPGPAPEQPELAPPRPPEPGPSRRRGRLLPSRAPPLPAHPRRRHRRDGGDDGEPRPTRACRVSLPPGRRDPGQPLRAPAPARARA